LTALPSTITAKIYNEPHRELPDPGNAMRGSCLFAPGGTAGVVSKHVLASDGLIF